MAIPIALARTEQKWSLAAKLLRAVSHPDYQAGGSFTQIGDRALEFVDRTVPDFREMIQGKTVLDYGCGFGNQALLMKKIGARSVVGYDRYPQFPPPIDGVTFTDTIPTDRFDIVLSCGAFEHFADPRKELAPMIALMRERLVITWAEPWYSHSGSHMNFFTPIPWVNLLFSEATLMHVRSLYREDGATRFADCGLGGGVNQMTVARFERLMRETGLQIERLQRWPTKGLPVVTSIPVLRELLTSACTCILRPEQIRAQA